MGDFFSTGMPQRLHLLLGESMNPNVHSLSSFISKATVGTHQTRKARMDLITEAQVSSALHDGRWWVSQEHLRQVLQIIDQSSVCDRCFFPVYKFCCILVPSFSKIFQPAASHQNKVPSKINWFLSSPQVPYGKAWGSYMERSSRIWKTSFWSTYHIFIHLHIYTHIHLWYIHVVSICTCVDVYVCASLGIAVASCPLLAMPGD